LRLTLRALQVALAAAALIALQPLLHFAEPIERLVRLRAAVLRAVGRRLTHRIGGFLHLLHRVVQLRPLLLIARELPQLPRGLFGFVGERALPGARIPRRALARLRHAPLPLHLLLLPPRELLQLLDQLFHLFAQLCLRQVEEHHVLAELLRLGLGLVADDVERRRDDFALLLRELADLLAAASTAAARL